MTFFENFIKIGIYDTYVSEYVIQEIEQTGDLSHRARLLRVLTDYSIIVHRIYNIDDIEYLTQSYLQNNIFPEKNYLMLCMLLFA